jgi:ligand-binding sensor domain-containing protein
MKWKIVLLFVFLVSALMAGAQQLHLKHFTVDDGLPSNELYQVIQDTAGNLLIATDRGAVRYDGYSFGDIPLNTKLTGKPVYYIYQTVRGGVYFSSLQGRIYQYRSDTLFDYAYNDRTARLFNHPGILIANSISASRDTFWISFNNDYNYNYKVGTCYVTKNGTVDRIEKPDGIYFDLQHQFYYRQLSQSSAGVTRHAVYITWPDGSVTKDEANLSWQGGYIRRLFYGRCGVYEFFSMGRQLFIYENRKKVGTYLFPDNVLTIAAEKDRGFYVGFENRGVVYYPLTSGTITGPEERYLDGYSVTCVYRDDQQGLWFSTLENGLFYHHPSQARLWEANSRIVSIERKGAKVYIGHQSGLIECFAGSQKLSTMQVPMAEGSSLIRLSFAANDSLLAITHRGYFTKGHTGWQFRPGKDILLLPDKKGQLYGASAATAELNVYDEDGSTLLVKRQLSKRIISMFADSKQNIWIGTWEGLLRYENQHLLDYSSKHPVFRDRVVAMGELPGGDLVVASLGNGLAVYRNNKLYTLSTLNGLRSATINAMVVDGNDIWIGTNKGLTMARLEKDSFRVVHLGLEAGLPSLDVHQFTVGNDWLYIKWVSRLVVLNKKEMLKTDGDTRTVITSAIVNDRRGAYAARPSLRYDENALTFHFTCTNLSSAWQQEYAYRLDGFDRVWHRTKERYVRYPYLPPGHYQFKVQAINLQDNTASALASYSFGIKPAFWQRWWFPVLIVSVVVLLLLAIFQMRLNAIREKNNLLLDLAENRQKVLVQLIHPHFVFNVLNTIQGAVLKQDKMVAASLVARFAKLMRLSMELSKEKWVGLEKEIDLLTRYFELEEIRSPGRFEYTIDAMPPMQPSEIKIPSMLIQPFVENAIKHGVMHLADRKGYIHIQLQLQRDALMCTIDDNGIGRQQSERINKKSREGHESSGIEITINRLRLLHREQNTAFVYEIIDKQSRSGEPEGTTIRFSIPFKKVNETDQRGHH